MEGREDPIKNWEINFSLGCLVKNQVVLGNQIVCATSCTTRDGESYQVSHVRLKKKVVIPPCSGTVKDAFPLPRIKECLDTLAKVTYMSTLDLASGYWQLEVAEEDRHKTAFISCHGLFEDLRMGFGLCNAPATFSRAMQSVLHVLLWVDVSAYLDDVIVLGLNFEVHLTNLAKVFQQLRLHNLKLKPRKCVLFREEVNFLGNGQV